MSDDEWAKVGDQWMRDGWSVFIAHWGGGQSWRIARGSMVLDVHKRFKTAQAAMAFADEMDEGPDK